MEHPSSQGTIRQAVVRDEPPVPAGVYHEDVPVPTPGGLEFVDITTRVAAVIERSGIADGLVTVQSTHTTAAVVVNEAEPLLLEDLKALLERVAPRDGAYRHDDFSVRTVNMQPDEPANGHAHCKALLLRTSETLSLRDGALCLGRWQRVFLVELDVARKRTVAITIVGR